MDFVCVYLVDGTTLAEKQHYICTNPYRDLCEDYDCPIKREAAPATINDYLED